MALASAQIVVYPSPLVEYRPPLVLLRPQELMASHPPRVYSPYGRRRLRRPMAVVDTRDAGTRRVLAARTGAASRKRGR